MGNLLFYIPEINWLPEDEAVESNKYWFEFHLHLKKRLNNFCF
jgi:hypothetical protein